MEGVEHTCRFHWLPTSRESWWSVWLIIVIGACTLEELADHKLASA